MSHAGSTVADVGSETDASGVGDMLLELEESGELEADPCGEELDSCVIEVDAGDLVVGNMVEVDSLLDGFAYKQ